MGDIMWGQISLVFRIPVIIQFLMSLLRKGIIKEFQRVLMVPRTNQM